MDKKYITCCNKCGRKKYKVIQEMGGITISKGTCQICKKKTWLIPGSDWAFAEGDDSKWD